MMWFDEDEKEYHSGLYFRKYKGDNIASPGLELLFDTVQEAAEYVKGNCSTTEEEDISYKLRRKTHTLACGMKAAFSVQNYISTT